MKSAVTNTYAKAGREPVRSCVICRRRMGKHDLARHVPSSDRQELVPDPAQRLPGRGFYVCGEANCQRAFAHFTGWRRKLKGVVHGKNQG